MWRILTIVSAEPDQEGDSRDARENINGYFMTQGDYVDTNTNKKGSPTRSETSKVTGNSRNDPILENDRFREARTKRHRLPRMKELRLSKTSLETIFSKYRPRGEF